TVERLESREVLAAQFVSDINTGTLNSDPSPGVDVDGTLFFTARDASGDVALYKTDGTSSGTVLVKRVVPSLASWAPDHLTDVNGTLFFSAYDDVNGNELWKSDGTESGTVLVADIVPGPDGSGPTGFCAVGDELFFEAFM